MRKNELKPIFCDAIPTKPEMEEGILYICIQCNVADHLCPCGCGEEVITMFHAQRGWTLTYDGQHVSLNPSIGNWSFPCSSHYWITENKVVWCSEAIDQPKEANLLERIRRRIRRKHR